MSWVAVFHRLQVDADDLAAADGIKQVGEVERRAPEGGARLNDGLGLQFPDQLSVGLQVAWPRPDFDAHVSGTVPRASLLGGVICGDVELVFQLHRLSRWMSHANCHSGEYSLIDQILCGLLCRMTLTRTIRRRQVNGLGQTL